MKTLYVLHTCELSIHLRPACCILHLTVIITYLFLCLVLARTNVLSAFRGNIIYNAWISYVTNNYCELLYSLYFFIYRSIILTPMPGFALLSSGCGQWGKDWALQRKNIHLLPWKCVAVKGQHQTVKGQKVMAFWLKKLWLTRYFCLHF